ncbi:sensor histidine kinase [Tenacibaculum retecalamus]|uniref:sensor histidine kinase n=1 Tax=Tenacibaculum retecalamus TaxID=3018315 RepID=UPI0023D93ADE|nr:histidine kinase [Tenacibaculum retecalamus]WBX70097.1 histidine kinase [Tenacibaculum retecalamus]
MKKTIQYLQKNQTLIVFLFIFSWVLTLKNKIGFATSWNNFVFHPDAPFWVFIDGFIIFIFTDFIKRKTKNNIKKETPSVWSYLRFFGISFICYIFIINIFGLFISFIFNTIPRNYSSSYQITYRIFTQIIDFIVFGGFSLAYLYFKENKNYKKRLNAYEISNSKSKIQQLKAQLNPHFLFNNLNILDQLIEENQEKASNFLNHFSELYRYVLKNSTRELIYIKEELIFIQNYFELMEKKYQGYYQLIIQNDIKNSTLIVPPFCLQILVENAIVHNLGTFKKPVIINISIENGIKITNNKIDKESRNKRNNGIALKNLNEQFKLLTNNPITIKDSDDYFTIILPLIKINNDA